MKRIIIKGCCQEIDKNINYILSLCKLAEGEIIIVGIICEDRKYDSIDGIPCVAKDFDDYDYVIILKEKERFRKQVVGYIKYKVEDTVITPMNKLVSSLVSIKKKNWIKWNTIIDKIYQEEKAIKPIVDDRIIDSDLLYTPGFDFLRYIELREKGISIISNNCWGGYAYHYLRLPVKTPFVNMWMNPSDCMKVINNLQYYLNEKLKIVDSGYDKGRRKWYPVVALGDVKLYWNHCFSVDELKTSVSQFIRRSKRVDYNRQLAFVYFEDAGMAKKYENEINMLPLKRKIGISHDYAGDNIYLAKDYVRDINMFDSDFFKYVNSSVRKDNYSIIKPFDVFKLLNMEDSFVRI